MDMGTSWGRKATPGMDQTLPWEEGADLVGARLAGTMPGAEPWDHRPAQARASESDRPSTGNHGKPIARPATPTTKPIRTWTAMAGGRAGAASGRRTVNAGPARRRSSLPSSGFCALAWVPTACMRRTTPGLRPGRPERRSQVASSARWIRTVCSLPPSGPSGRRPPGGPTSSGWRCGPHKPGGGSGDLARTSSPPVSWPLVEPEDRVEQSSAAREALPSLAKRIGVASPAV